MCGMSVGAHLPDWTLVLPVVTLMCSSLQAAGEIPCVFNHISFFPGFCSCCLFWFGFFYGKKMSLAFRVGLVLLVGVQMLMSCN